MSIALEAAFGFPMAGVVFNALNSRLAAGELAWIVAHAGSRVLFADHAPSPMWPDRSSSKCRGCGW